MDTNYHGAKLNVLGQPQQTAPTPVQLLADDQQIRQCPYCYETISQHAKKCWRCLEYFSPPREELDDRVFQLARREVLQDCLVDIKKWITRIGFGSVAGIALLGVLSMMRFQDVLEDMVTRHVEVATTPVLTATEETLTESEQVLDNVQDNIRLAQHRISRFDQVEEKLVDTENAVLKIESAKQSLETRAEKLGGQFERLETRFLNAKRELREDRQRRLEQMLGNFASQVVTYDKLQEMLGSADSSQHQQLLASLAPMQLRRIGLISPFTLSPDQPPVVFSSGVRLQWQFEGHEVGELAYRVHYDTQRDFLSGGAQQATTRLAHHILPADFPHGPVYWRVEAIDRNGRVQATSDVGHFEFYANSIDRIRQTGVVRVGVTCSYGGEFAYFDEQQGRLTGYDIELTRWLAPRLLPDLPLVRPVFIGYNWNRLLDSVRRNEVDLIISTITITPEREEEFGLKFTRPYYKTYQVCVVLRDSNIRSPAQLHGRRIAVQAGTSSETVGESFTESSNLDRVTNSGDAFQELLTGQVDAVITDFDFAQDQIRQLGRPAAVLKLQENDFPETYTGVRSEDYGIAVAKPETEFLERLNNAIDAARRENILETLKYRFVTSSADQTALRRLPIPEIASPFTHTRLPAYGVLR